ncbi:Ca-activated chloride channel family protein [Ereboglobus sp. PH5-10]|uniref:YfbK domain-containing protein n=1 Tax=Ereboglobus sp. PH5-10 TaxID=2940629 RepID=UPI0024051418|nr:von Willebrand factor type A domain-containing protein [Ereboglobus sp. PH5-10]MDF9826879.1 Ca-activated chloride channel family protein [Ereboglobus sp. PH5-10]
MKHNDNNHSSDNTPAPQFSADDPRLTAYALGEMDAAERAVFETEIAGNPAAQAAVAEIRALAGQLETVFAAEPATEQKNAPITPEQIEDWRAAREAEAQEARKRAKKPFRFPYFLVAGLATACFAVAFFAILKPAHDSRQAEKLAMQKAQAMYVSLPVEAESRAKEASSAPASVASRPTPAQTAATLERFTVTGERHGQAKLIMEQRAADNVVTAIAIDSFGELTQGSVGEFMKYMPGIGASAVSQNPGAESYTRYADNGFLGTTENPLSTFSADIDTASYTNVRRFLNRGQRPPADAVRVEEMINYFAYNYAPPAKESGAPFAATMEVAAAPWNPEHRLVRIGIKGREVADDSRPPANLVFLLDVSGSMDEPNKLPLVKESMRMLVNRLRPSDRIAIVTYANTIDLALPSTAVSEKTKILDTLDALRATGGTNGGKGIQLAYEIARANFLKEGANRVILCTDGDFNIGVTSNDELATMIEEKAKSGVFLSVLGFGMGNLKDSRLQTLANKGNGNHGYIDNRAEARRLLVEQTAGTLVTIAKDVKLQVEFNPAQAAAYRLIGYEKRLLAKEDFNNDKADAGEIGAGHTVTALYEVIPAKSAAGAPSATSAETDAPVSTVDPLKYQTQTVVTTAPKLELTGELLTLKIRYKAPSADMSDKIEFTLEDKGVAFDEASPDFKFTCSVAAFAMLLRNSPDKGVATYDSVLEWAEPGMTGATGAELERRGEFTDLVRRVKQIATN